MSCVVEWVADLLVPEEAVRLDGTAVVQCGLQIEAAIDVNGQSGAVTVEDLQDRFDALEVVSEVGAPPIFIFTTE